MPGFYLGRGGAALKALLLAALCAGPAAAEPAAVVSYTIQDGREIAKSLTGLTGDPVAGARLYETAGCAGCHDVKIPPGGRLTAGEVRLWIVSPATILPDTEMPGAYLAGQRTGPEDPLYGGPALTAQEVENLVAFLTER